MGLRGLRHQRLRLRGARRRGLCAGRPRHRDAVPYGTGPTPSRRARTRRGDLGRGRPRGGAGRGDAAALRRRPLAAGAQPRNPRDAGPPATWPAKSPPGRSSCCETNRSTAVPCCHFRTWLRCGWPSSAASPTPRISATTARVTCGTCTVTPCWTGCAARRPTSSMTRGAISHTLPPSPARLMSPSSWWAIPPSTRASSWVR